ncbi:hypothetical protein EDD86DRAFT_188104, partial [Gorgonomyces haynaldii]
RDKLDGLKQIRSVQAYATEFQKLLLQLPRSTYHDADMKDAFVRKLKPDIRKLLVLQNPASLEEAVQQALRVDGIWFQVADRSAFRHQPYLQLRSVSFSVDAVDFQRSNGRPYKG